MWKLSAQDSAAAHLNSAIVNLIFESFQMCGPFLLFLLYQAIQENCVEFAT